MTRKLFVRITYDPADKEELLLLIPSGSAVAPTDTSAEYWIEGTDKSTIWNDMRRDFQEAGKGPLFEKIKIDIKDVDERGYVK